ncbi:MAG: FAD-dependent oxidoreductase [Caldilineaceae bacterium]
MRAHTALLITVRAGGHHVAGFGVQDDALMIDLSLMKGIQVDPQGRTVCAQAGVTIGELDRETQVFGLATPMGVVSETGIAGLTLGGGMGWLRRKYGLACDNSHWGRYYHRRWCIPPAQRHGGQRSLLGDPGRWRQLWNCHRLYLPVTPVGPIVMSATTMCALADARQVLSGWREFMQEAPEEVTSTAFFWGIPPTPPIPEELWGQTIVGVGALYAGDAEEGERITTPCALAKPILDLSGKMPYTMVQKSLILLPHAGHLYYNKSTDLTSPDDEVLDALIRVVSRTSQPHPPSSCFGSMEVR